MGGITSLYTTFGGMKAVIWTDVLQSLTIWLGIGLMLWAALSQIDGGIAEVERLARKGGRLRFWNPSFNPSDTLALWPCLVGGTVLNLAALPTDQALINSLSTATTVDFYQRLLRPKAPAEHYARFGRMATAAWGIVATGLALFMDRLGDLVLAYSKVSSLVAGPMLGIFLLGMLTRR